MRAIFAVFLLLFPTLTGCTLVPYGKDVVSTVKQAIDTGVSDRKQYNDDKAELLLTMPCDISIGAYFRLDNSTKQEALSMLCSGKKPGEPDPILEELK